MLHILRLHSSLSCSALPIIIDMYFFNHFRNKERSLYDALEHEDRQTDATTKKTKGLCSSTALPWGLSAFLLVALIFVAVRTETIDKMSELGTYEFGFVTDIGNEALAA